jgi:phosphoribosylpyrophosphate synthetase
MLVTDQECFCSCRAVCAPFEPRDIQWILISSRYFPYSRQSKKKSHRGAITARMIANLLTIAGVDHVITLDLHVCVTPVYEYFATITTLNSCLDGPLIRIA